MTSWSSSTRLTRSRASSSSSTTRARTRRDSEEVPVYLGPIHGVGCECSSLGAGASAMRAKLMTNDGRSAIYLARGRADRPLPLRLLCWSDSGLGGGRGVEHRAGGYGATLITAPQGNTGGANVAMLRVLFEPLRDPDRFVPLHLPPTASAHANTFRLRPGRASWSLQRVA